MKITNVPPKLTEMGYRRREIVVQALHLRESTILLQCLSSRLSQEVRPVRGRAVTHEEGEILRGKPSPTSLQHYLLQNWQVCIPSRPLQQLHWATPHPILITTITITTIITTKFSSPLAAYQEGKRKNPRTTQDRAAVREPV
ncbi:hypothetical protein E2C01_009092 [Portunus trituberculatus]|uniref:Uncharacterized protein n=1 Tax=Portunus trituberculatus TaxID=210409 RepID=A0A5B7D4I5_PORTR|nr:hypothetical protein [Portunus trituberculatus]